MAEVRALTHYAVRTALHLNEGGELPTEFRIFAPGKIETSKGADLFDAEAARSVMKHYADEGVDVPVDLEHDSLSEGARMHRSDAGDARGWFKLELRADGSLWAIDVRWTPDGERRLKEKTQRYISPAFTRDTETGRILRLLNVALVSMPATHDAPALVAASRTAGTTQKERGRAAVFARARRMLARDLQASKKRATLRK